MHTHTHNTHTTHTHTHTPESIWDASRSMGLVETLRLEMEDVGGVLLRSRRGRYPAVN